MPKLAPPRVDPEKRVSRHEPMSPTQDLERGLKVKAPALPGARKFSAQTRAWYKVWAESEQAQQFLQTDWQRLWMLASLVEVFYTDPDPKIKHKMMGEVRLSEKELGATAESRLRLRWRMAENAAKDERQERTAARPKRRGDPRLALVKDAEA